MSNDLLKSIETSYILINEYNYNNNIIIKIDVKINSQEEIKLYKY